MYSESNSLFLRCCDTISFDGAKNLGNFAPVQTPLEQPIRDNFSCQDYYHSHEKQKTNKLSLCDDLWGGVCGSVEDLHLLAKATKS